MYHGVISDDLPIVHDREPGAGLYDVHLDDFVKQMECLKRRNDEVTTLIENTQKVNTRRVILTFDDGEYNHFKNAFRILSEFGYPAYFFVTVDRIGTKGYMGWEELRQLRDAGMIIGSHGLTHQILVHLKDKEIERELTESKEILERNLTINVGDLSVQPVPHRAVEVELRGPVALQTASDQQFVEPV